MQYHISRQGQTYGPYPAEHVRRMLSEGRLLPTDLCWTEGMAGWEPLGSILGATVAPVQPPPPRPVPPLFKPDRAGPDLSLPSTQAGNKSPWPLPPDLHWLAILLLSYVTCGLFGIIWTFIQANFVRKIHPGSPARALLISYYAVLLLAFPFLFLTASMQENPVAIAGIMVIAIFLDLFLFWIAVFSIRRSLLYHYNSAENIGLRLNPALTFFFNVLYFQHHFSRIARWKNTGVLS